MEGQSQGDVALSEHDESEWDRFRSQLAFARGFWLGFVFARSSYEARIVRERMKAWLEARGQTMQILTPTSPEELRDAIPWLLDPQRQEAGCVWVEGFFLDPGENDDESPWALAWDHVFLRINLRREAFRTRMKGALIFAAPSSIKPRIREAAPDMWSIRSIVLELSGGVHTVVPTPQMARVRQEVVDSEQRNSYPDPDFWAAEAERLPAATEDRAQALFMAAVGYGLRQQHERAIASLSESAEIHRALCKMPDRQDYYAMLLSTDLRQLSGEQLAVGAYAAALQSAKEAIDISQKISPTLYLQVHRLNLVYAYTFLARAQDELDQPEAAIASTHEAIQLAEKLKSVKARRELRPLLGALYRGLGARYYALDDIEKAIRASQRAVTIFRRIEPNQRDLFLTEWVASLSQLGVFLIELGRFEEALPFVQEGLDAAWTAFERKSLALEPDAVYLLVALMELAREALGIPPDPTFLARKARFAELSAGSS